MGELHPRVFVAVWPPAHVVSLLAGLPRPPSNGVRWVPPENWHVTLRFLGAADPEEVGRALRGASLPGATATLGPAVSRMGRGVVVVPVAGLEALGSAVAAATATIGRPPDPRPFRGHLTLARLRGRGSCGVAGARVRGSFAVEELLVVSSRTGHEGATYEVVDRVPLLTAP